MNRREATKNFYWTMWAWMSEQDEIKTKVLSNLMLRVVYHACVSYHANAIGFASI